MTLVKNCLLCLFITLTTACTMTTPPTGDGPEVDIAECGNGIIEEGEVCDDGNAELEACAYGETECTVCNTKCEEEAGATSLCGDGTVDEENESCDDGNTDLEACAYGEAE